MPAAAVRCCGTSGGPFHARDPARGRTYPTHARAALHGSRVRRLRQQRHHPRGDGRLLEMLVIDGRLSASVRARALYFMRRQQVRDRLPFHLPPGTDIAHKTGSIAGVRNDAGILFVRRGPVLVCAFTRDLKVDLDGTRRSPRSVGSCTPRSSRSGARCRSAGRRPAPRLLGIEAEDDVRSPSAPPPVKVLGIPLMVPSRVRRASTSLCVEPMLVPTRSAASCSLIGHLGAKDRHAESRSGPTGVGREPGDLFRGGVGCSGGTRRRIPFAAMHRE